MENVPAAELRELAGALRDERYAAGKAVVLESDAGDRCFLVASGRVEFTVGLERTPVGGAGPGGYFGELALVLPSGTRQATVTALTDVELLSLDRDSFRAAVAAHEPAGAALEQHAKRILVARFLAEVGAFAALGPEQREALAARLLPRSVQAGKLIVREGEIGGSCFVIRSGSVQVFVERDGVETTVDTLHPGSVFGEGTLLTGAPRIASVRAAEPTELLELPLEALLEASREAPQVSRELVQLVRLREFPCRAEGIELHERRATDGSEMTVLKNPRRGTYYRLSPRGRFVWERLDGRNNLRRLTLDYLEEFNQFAPQFVADLIGGLAAGGFLEVSEVERDWEAPTSTGWRLLRTVLSARRLVDIQVGIRGVDAVIDRTYRGGVRLLFTPAGRLLMLAVSVAGLVSFVVVGRNATQLIAHARADLLLFIYPGLVLSIAIHEAGHAFATKAYGRTVLRAGIGWYWFSPIAFVDTSDMWLGTRKQRIVVSLAGPAADLVTAGVVSIAALLVSNGTVAAGLWSLTLPLYFGVLLNLNPLLEFDGYHVLTDLVDRPNLRVEALGWLRRSFPTLLRSPRVAKGHLLELAYGLAALLYIAAMAALTVVLYRLVVRRWVDAVLPGDVAGALAWVATVLVVALAAGAAVADMRRLERSRTRLT